MGSQIIIGNNNIEIKVMHLDSLEIDRCNELILNGDAGTVNVSQGSVRVSGNVHYGLKVTQGSVKCGNVEGGISVTQGNVQHKG